MTANQPFAQAVLEGLSQSPRTLPSRYFYDEIGDALFVEIMHMPEYYPFRAEFEIFSEHTDALINGLGIQPDAHFDLIELGAGDGTKTKALLRSLTDRAFQFSYQPIDISANALDSLEADLKESFPALSVSTRQGDYFGVLESMRVNPNPKVVLFLGSSLGNMPDERASRFLDRLAASLNPGDRLLLGLDLIKPAEVVLPAYNDAQGLTARFNLNLLTRINRELGGNFDLDNWEHRPEYTIEEGIAKSYLVSTEDQTVSVEVLEKSFAFAKGERIHTEISRKYNDAMLVDLTRNAPWELRDRISDAKGLFADFILERVAN